MFGLPFASPKMLVAVLVGAILPLVLGGIGYRLGSTAVQQKWDAERAATLAETADALALFAARHAALEAKYAQERDKKQRVIERRVEVVKREIQRIPDRGCPVQPDTRRMLVDTLCTYSRNAARPECVPGDLPAAPDATGGGPARGGDQSLGRGAHRVG